MQAYSFSKFCLGMCYWTDSSTSSIERECHAGPHPKLERDLQQEVEGAADIMLEVPRTAQSQYYLADHGASRTSFNFESSCERFITFVNDAELAILSTPCYTIGQCIVVMNTKYLHVKINNL